LNKNKLNKTINYDARLVEIEVPININIVTESERFDTQKMLAIGYEKSKIKNKQENKTISNI